MLQQGRYILLDDYIAGNYIGEYALGALILYPYCVGLFFYLGHANLS
ncbi:hypothetical protein SAMN02745171_01463 [Porphyromonas circumdentaria]|uniref:Uncharacterized protein n=1 Tax=Porphyromonas circumdentaria TaxID=29524 RepID=A0A1T4PGQ5_9PORP|nr:hypothetical protein [Porphyromonas circumdentaria]SJZ90679.1 hypothetical protein SAMN02745171_01463 [Porphyromonas circumdentaria]